MYILALTLFAIKAFAQCQCGHIVNSTVADDFALFTEALETTFLHGKPSVTWSSEPGMDWRVQEYNTTAEAARGPYGKAAQIGNVVVNTISNNVNGQNTLGDQLGLQLWVRQHLITNGSDELVPIAEVVTARDDILYGSFRAGVKTTAVNGTCAAFFFFHDDSSEIDMESLSKDQMGPRHWPLNLVNQSPQSVANGFDATNTPGKRVYSLQFSPSTDFHEYRFDWLPDRIDFYVDSDYLVTFTENIPDSPGQIHLIHWSNGDPHWSGGPPIKDAAMIVSYVEAYFNSSDISRQNAANADCEIATRPTHANDGMLCSIANGAPGTSVLPSSTTSSNTLSPTKNSQAVSNHLNLRGKRRSAGIASPTTSKSKWTNSWLAKGSFWSLGAGFGVIGWHRLG